MLSVADMGREVISQRRKERDQLIMGQGRRRSRVQPPKVRKSTDEMFADLFTDVGRRSVPPMIVAVVMVLQRIEGCSDREAVDRFMFDARWKYAAGGPSCPPAP